MKIWSLFLVIVFSISTITRAEEVSDRATELMKMGQSSLEQKEYIKARYLFKQAYSAFASRENYEKAVECGIQVVDLYARENFYKEGFDLCRDMNQLIAVGAEKLHKPFYDLQFLVTEERLKMYIKLKATAQAKEQLTKLEEISGLAKTDSLGEELLYIQAEYYYTFGLNAQGDASFQKLISQYKEKKNYEKVNECYRNLIEIAKKSNNAAFACRTYENFILWADSVKVLTAQDELNVLKRKNEESLNIIAEKDDSLAGKQYMIIGLCIFVAILIAGLILLAVIWLRCIVYNKKLKKSIKIANEHNELKTQFISNISAQMAPALETLETSAGRISEKALQEGEQMQLQVASLKKFSDDIQELSTLENSLTEIYELREVNASAFSEAVMAKVSGLLQPGVTAVVNAAKSQIKTNPEQLERILIHLLRNAAFYTSEGKVILDFKKRGAHTYQFIVTDTGCGIPEELQEKVFKPFAEIKDLTQGDGLGLPICSLLAVKMNGSLTLDTAYNKGSRFILELHI
ncbi:HAMP domain-containing sensor histidine kinase [Bacteroides sp.]|uniref:sensor histidine kinase n=1 Tax=Bacteroides sp. TaxID=29523 RepID=UPI002619E6B7|nr:HAMP domain-containing sensor histidine kinase [Bacteroides sp.]MDD3039384.1 HAMP domain-containing sensor histidine kinase [Bacteroides sp.]